MSYARQLAQQLSRCAPCGPCAGIGALPSIVLTDWWVDRAGSWEQTIGGTGQTFTGQIAHPTQTSGAQRLDVWAAQHCAAGDLVFMTPPYDDHGQPTINLYAGAVPLPQGFHVFTGPALEPYACPGGGTVTQPGLPTPPAATATLAGACLYAVTQHKDVMLPEPVRDPDTGKMVVKVRYDAAADDCRFEFEGWPWAKIVAAVAGLAGGYVIATRVSRRR